MSLLGGLALGDDAWGVVFSHSAVPDWLRISAANRSARERYSRILPLLLLNVQVHSMSASFRKGDYVGVWVHLKRQGQEAMRLLTSHDKQIYVWNKNCLLYPILIMKAPASIRMVNVLLLGRANVNAKSPSGSTALHICAREEASSKIAMVLIKNRADVNSFDRAEVLPIHIASSLGNEGMVSLLLEAKAGHLDAPIRHHLSGHRGNLDALTMWTRSARGRFWENKGRTPLLLAANSNSYACVKMLMEAGAQSVNLRDNAGESPMIVASRKGNLEILRTFIAVNEEEDLGVPEDEFLHVSPLYSACSEGHLSAAKLLLDAKASSDVPNKYGLRPILSCAIHGFTDVMKLLIDAKARFHEAYDTRTNRFSTLNDNPRLLRSPLLLAATRGNATTVATLLSMHAAHRLDLPKADWIIPLRFALKKGHEAVLHAFVSAGFRPDPPTPPRPFPCGALRRRLPAISPPPGASLGVSGGRPPTSFPPPPPPSCLISPLVATGQSASH